MPDFFYSVVFYLFGLIAIASALAFVTRKSPVAAALWLVNTMFCLAALYVMLDAHFIGAIQVLVYAGAIMVVFLFVVMLLNLGHVGEISDIRGKGGRLVAGLYAEGRVVSQSSQGLVVPQNAVNTTATPAWALRVNNGKTERVDVTLGLRDQRTERVQIVSGLAEGDTVLRGASQGITPGTPVSVSDAQ